MSRILKSKKRFLLGVAASLVVAAAAFAYWTTSGDGTGSATAGTDQGVTVTGDPADGIYPGGEVAVTTNIANDSLDQSQHVNYLHVAISDDDATDDCDPADFTYKADEDTTGPASNPYSILLDEEIAGGGDLDVPGKVFMANTSVSQDDCKDAVLTLDYDVNNTP
jgi:hypothetical protein